MKDTGYVLVSDELMQVEALHNILFDNFDNIRDISTVNDRLNNTSRLEMSSELFMNGYGQYHIIFQSKADGSVSLKEVNPVIQ